jgi:hypothetical protein
MDEKEYSCYLRLGQCSELTYASNTGGILKGCFDLILQCDSRSGKIEKMIRKLSAVPTVSGIMVKILRYAIKEFRIIAQPLPLSNTVYPFFQCGVNWS